MFGGVYGDARMPNWPHWHRTPLPGIASTGLRRDKYEGTNTFNKLFCGKKKKTKSSKTFFKTGDYRLRMRSIFLGKVDNFSKKIC